MDRPARPTLVVNPPDDGRFASFAMDLLGHVATAEDFQARLRSEYPHATVHRRELAGEARVVWYVYREGRWIHPGTTEPPEGNDADTGSDRGPPGDRVRDPA
jgi:hypothetical protein